MKFKSMIIFYFIFVIAIIPIVTEKLSLKENKERLNTCGKDKDIYNGIKNNRWHILAAFENGNNIEYISSASLISNRHFITSAFSILNSQMEWLMNKEKLDYTACSKGALSLRIPMQFLRNLTIREVSCQIWGSCHSIRPVRAYLLNICTKEIENNFHRIYCPMLVEVENPIDSSIPCLVDNSISIQKDDAVDVCPLNPKSRKRFTSPLNLEIVNIASLQTSGYSSEKKTGNPLTKWKNEKLIIIGNWATGDTTDSSRSNIFFNMKWLVNEICDLIGVCAKNTVTKPPRRTTTTRTTTKRLTTTKATLKTTTKTLPVIPPRPNVTKPITRSTTKRTTTRSTTKRLTTTKATTVLTTTPVKVTPATTTLPTTSLALETTTTATRTTAKITAVATVARTNTTQPPTTTPLSSTTALPTTLTSSSSTESTDGSSTQTSTHPSQLSVKATQLVSTAEPSTDTFQSTKPIASTSLPTDIPSSLVSENSTTSAATTLSENSTVMFIDQPSSISSENIQPPEVSPVIPQRTVYLSSTPMPDEVDYEEFMEFKMEDIEKDHLDESSSVKRTTTLLILFVSCLAL